MRADVQEIMDRFEATGILTAEDKTLLTTAFYEEWEKVRPIAVLIQWYKRQLSFGFFPALPAPREEGTEQ